MRIKVLYFAQLREAAGRDGETLEFPRPVTAAELSAGLLARPEFFKYRDLAFRYAVNDEFVNPDRIIPEGAAVALIPPVAGG